MYTSNGTPWAAMSAKTTETKKGKDLTEKTGEAVKPAQFLGMGLEIYKNQKSNQETKLQHAWKICTIIMCMQMILQYVYV